MRRSLDVLAFVVLLALSGCNDVLAPGSPRSELDTNRQKWRGRGYTDYAFTLRVGCFCVETGPLRVTVVNDSVVSVVRVSTGETIARAGTPTVNKLFDLIENAIARPADDLRVTYDAELGFPREIYVDGSFRIADDETTYTVSELAPRASPR